MRSPGRAIAAAAAVAAAAASFPHATGHDGHAHAASSDPAAVSALQLPLPAKTLDCSSWGVTPGQVAAPNPEFTKAYDLTGVPNIPPNKYPTGVATGAVDPCSFHATSQPPGYCNAECGCSNGLAIDSCPSAGKWANTYDDGPSQFTSTVVNTLKKYGNTKAMFFVIGGNVCQHPQQLIDLVNAGHEIGVHTWSHQRLTNLTNEQIIAEMKYTENAITALTGVKPKYMRPPFGNMDARVKFILDKMGYTAVHWNADTNDWNFNFVPDTPQNEAAANKSILDHVSQYITTDGNAKKGTISLEHDIARIPASIADAVLAKITSSGWQPVSITNCLGVSSWISGGESNPTASGTPVNPASGRSSPSSDAGARRSFGMSALCAVVGALSLALVSSL